MDLVIIYLIVGCVVSATEHKIDKHLNDLKETYYYFLSPIIWLFSIIYILIMPIDDLDS